MLSVEAALAAIMDGVSCLAPETIALDQLTGRVSAANITARLTQPPFTASAMDGYAVSSGDARQGAVLRVIGEARAGTPFTGKIMPGEALRIFTGGVVPDGADHIVIQEDVVTSDGQMTIMQPQSPPRHIRKAGVDFRADDLLVHEGTTFHAIHASVLAAANIAQALVVRRPRIVIFSNGDELREPGSTLQPGEIINANHYAIRAMVQSWGGVAEYAGCVADQRDAIEQCFRRHGEGADIIVPIGGASVGDYDMVKPALRAAGGVISFEKVAVRPGKPVWYAKLGATRIIGLPGNPASAIITAALFLQPLVRRLAATKMEITQSPRARLAGPLPANGARESYLRAIAKTDPEAGLTAHPTPQDSSLLAPFLKANILIKRPAHAPALNAGDLVPIIWLR